MLDLSKTKFLYSCYEPTSTLKGLQIAFMGRSNVGKSSLINHLCQRKKLSKISSTPGKTQAINFFQIASDLYLVDLPGYGFAKVSSQIKKTFSELIQGYIKNTLENLFVLFLLDIRHLPTKEDQQLLNWLTFHQVPFQIIFTKCDKLSKSQLTMQNQKILASFGLLRDPPILNYSIKENNCRKILLQILNQIKKNGPHSS